MGKEDDPFLWVSVTFRGELLSFGRVTLIIDAEGIYPLRMRSGWDFTEPYDNVIQSSWREPGETNPLLN